MPERREWLKNEGQKFLCTLKDRVGGSQKCFDTSADWFLNDFLPSRQPSTPSEKSSLRRDAVCAVQSITVKFSSPASVSADGPFKDTPTSRNSRVSASQSKSKREEKKMLENLLSVI